MSFLGVTYVHDKNENFKEFLDTLPIPPEKAEGWLNSKPTSKLEKDGDTYISTTTFNGETKVVKFENGVEFEENLDDGISCKTTITVDGDVVTQVQNFGNGGAMTFKKEYNDSELVVTMSSSHWDGTAKRYYVAE